MQLKNLLARRVNGPGRHPARLSKIALGITAMRKQQAPVPRSNGVASSGNPMGDALRTCRAAIWGLGLFSCLSNLLMLTGPLFMMQVYDRVLTSGSLPTLTALVGLVVLLYLFYGLIELIRSRVLLRIARRVDEQLSPSAFQLILRQPLQRKSNESTTAPIRDLDALRQFFSSQGPMAILDMPWMPFYLLILYLFHPVLGLIATTGAILLLCLAIISEISNRKTIRDATRIGTKRGAFESNCRRNAEVVQAMGMGPRLGALWSDINTHYQDLQGKAGDRAGLLSTITRTMRLLMQSIILAAGAWLAIGQEISPGAIIAGSIIMSRALAPIETAVANWRGLIAARQSAGRLRKALETPGNEIKTQLPKPVHSLNLSSVTLAPPGSQKIAVERVSFTLNAGDGLGIIGPSASGKSTLARAIVGVWPMIFGRICLDGAPLDQWEPHALGQHIGYLPQMVELFDGTIAQNIARFDPDGTADQVIQAARVAGVHDMILSLQNGYDTNIGEAGSVLSTGQRQRIGLARALYAMPFLVVLDEPNANLDVEGEEALSQAIRLLRQNGSIVVVIAHRPSVLASLSHMMVMERGKLKSFGPSQKIPSNKATHAAVRTPRVKAEL